jgi:hypothetical protein
MWSTMATGSWPDSARLIASGLKCGDRVYNNSSEAAHLGLTKFYLLNKRELLVLGPIHNRLAGPAIKISEMCIQTQVSATQEDSGPLGARVIVLRASSFASPWGESLPKSPSDQIYVFLGVKK